MTHIDNTYLHNMGNPAETGCIFPCTTIYGDRSSMFIVAFVAVVLTGYRCSVWQFGSHAKSLITVGLQRILATTAVRDIYDCTIYSGHLYTVGVGLLILVYLM